MYFHVCKSREATRAVSKHAQNRILLLDKSASKMEREVRDGSFAGPRFCRKLRKNSRIFLGRFPDDGRMDSVTVSRARAPAPHKPATQACHTSLPHKPATQACHTGRSLLYGFGGGSSR